MKSPLGPVLIAALLSAHAGASPAASVDAYQEFRRAHVQAAGPDSAFALTTPQFVAQFLQDSSSPYSSPVEQPDFTNATWWEDYVDAMRAYGASDAGAALDALHRQAGFTKARPGEDVVISEASVLAYRGREAAANAVKAGVDPDIFWQARDMSGSAITSAAGYALALQLLRDAANANDPADHQRMAIKPEVLARYLEQTNPDLIPESDLRYLADILRGAIQRRGARLDGPLAQRLPAAYRLARVAAAYADSKGYYSSRAYCTGNAPSPGQPLGPDAFEADRPLCFIAATDRGVQSWFRRQLRIDALKLHIHENTHHGFQRFAHLLGTVLILMDLVSFVEMIDATVAESLASEGEIGEERAELVMDRANRLTCRVAP